jgi:8-oxo-dGTP pyrophosphatase MutT (NUDIX family)
MVKKAIRPRAKSAFSWSKIAPALSSQTKETMLNLSPSSDRIGRACVCILEENLVLMVSYDDFFTFPGGGVNPGESFEEAATREAFEEAGARIKIIKFLYEDSEDQCRCYLAKLEHLEASPEGRIVCWVNVLEFPWCEDKQIKPALKALELRGSQFL